MVLDALGTAGLTAVFSMLALVGLTALDDGRGWAVLTVRLLAIPESFGIGGTGGREGGFMSVESFRIELPDWDWSPELVPGLLPIADDGRDDTMGLSGGLKKLDRRRRYAGDGGIFAMESMVRSARDMGPFDSEGVLGSGDRSQSSSCPSRNAVPDEVRDPDRRDSKSPTPSSCSDRLVVVDVDLLDTTRDVGTCRASDDFVVVDGVRVGFFAGAGTALDVNGRVVEGVLAVGMPLERGLFRLFIDGRVRMAD
jgi:hypothetical protein